MDYRTKKRTAALFWLFILAFIGLVTHLAYIQVISGPRLSRQALSQQSQVVSLEVPPRGQILDRRLRPLIVEREVWRVVVFPAAVADKTGEAGILAAILKTGSREAEVYLTGSPKVIPSDLSAEQVAVLKKQALPGVVVSRFKLRGRKPPLASHLIGYLGQDKPDNWVGKTGIEAYYDSYLQGSIPELAVRIYLDGKGRVIPGLGYRLEYNVIDKARKDIVLTIDRDIQEIVEKAIDKAGVQNGAVVVMDVDNGDIVAMASRPDFSLGLKPGNVSETVYNVTNNSEESFLNHCLSLYQPGSVFKVIVTAAAIEEGIVEPNDVFLCIGEKDDIIKCYQKGGHGLITFAQAMAYSCNPVFARVGLELGADKLINYAGRFGLNTDSIIGYEKNKSMGRSDFAARLGRIAQPYNLVNASVGQWPVEANVVQITAMMAAIANNGVYTSPRLVREIRNYDGTTAILVEAGPGIRAVSENTSRTVQAMLETVTKSGTGKQAFIEPGGSAGKTGSAQVGTEKIDAWFSGYAPVKDPRYAVTVIVTNGVSGGKTAAPIFKDIMEQILPR